MTYVEKKKEMLKEASNLGRSLKNEMRAFYRMHNIVYEDKILNRKTKELIALGIAISSKCESCVISHISSLIKLEASREEVAEAISVAIMMAGGPATVYGAKALACFDELKAEADNK